MSRHDKPIHVHPGNDLLIVFPTTQAATDARSALIQMGVPADRVVIGDEADRAAAVNAEMELELIRGVVTFRSLTRRHGTIPSFAAIMVSVIVLVLIVGALVALIPFGPAYFERYLIVIAAGCAMATMVAVLAIGAIRTGMLDSPSDAEAGVTLHLRAANDDACATLIGMQPLRVDEITADGHLAAGVHWAHGESVGPTGRHAVGW